MQIVSNSEAFQKGVRELRDLVGSTMGPAGGNVALTLLAMPGAIYRDGAKVIEKSDKTREDNTVKSTQAMHEFYMSLNPEQKTKFKNIQNKMHGQMKGRMKEHNDNKHGNAEGDK